MESWSIVTQTMAPSADQLAEIDRELTSFGKSDAELERVIGRARTLAAALSGEEGLSELLEGIDEALAKAREEAEASIPARPAPYRPAPKTSTAVGTPAPAPEPPDDEDEPIGSGLLEIPEEEIRRAELPPVLELPAEPKELEDAFAPAAVSDIHGLSVDELFDDATGVSEAVPSAGSAELSDLFAEDEPIRLSDPDLDMEALESEPPAPPPRPRTMPPPLPPGARASKTPPKISASAFPSDDEPDETLTGDRSELADDSFELLVDDEVLELDDLGSDAPAGDQTEPPPAEGDEERKGGLISRILGRK